MDNNKVFMAVCVLVLMLGGHTEAQEFVYRPLDGYFYNHWDGDNYANADDFYSEYEATHETVFLGFFKRYIVEDTLTVYGVAFSAFVDTGFTGIYVRSNLANHVHEVEYTDFDSSYLRIQARQYDGGAMTIVTEQRAAPMNMPTVGWLKGFRQVPKYPIKEAFFERAVQMTDTFYVGYFPAQEERYSWIPEGELWVQHLSRWPISHIAVINTANPSWATEPDDDVAVMYHPNGQWDYGRDSKGVDWYVFPIIAKEGNPEVGVADAAEPLKVLVAPNPARNMVGVSASLPIERLEVYSMAGEKMVESRPGYVLATLDVSRWPSGIYAMRIYTEGEVVTRKITVSH